MSFFQFGYVGRSVGRQCERASNNEFEANGRLHHFYGDGEASEKQFNSVAYPAAQSRIFAFRWRPARRSFGAHALLSPLFLSVPFFRRKFFFCHRRRGRCCVCQLAGILSTFSPHSGLNVVKIMKDRVGERERKKALATRITVWQHAFASEKALM